MERACNKDMKMKWYHPMNLLESGILQVLTQSNHNWHVLLQFSQTRQRHSLFCRQRSYTGHKDYIQALSLFHSSDQLASAAEDGSVRIWGKIFGG